MAKSVRFRINRAAGAELLKNNQKMQSMQNSAAASVLAQITSQFYADFGEAGSFEMAAFTTDRSSVKVVAASPRTATILKQNPMWLNQFVDNMII